MTMGAPARLGKSGGVDSFGAGNGSLGIGGAEEGVVITRGGLCGACCGDGLESAARQRV